MHGIYVYSVTICIHIFMNFTVYKKKKKNPNILLNLHKTIPPKFKQRKG